MGWLTLVTLLELGQAAPGHSAMRPLYVTPVSPPRFDTAAGVFVPGEPPEPPRVPWRDWTGPPVMLAILGALGAQLEVLRRAVMRQGARLTSVELRAEQTSAAFTSHLELDHGRPVPVSLPRQR